MIRNACAFFVFLLMIGHQVYGQNRQGHPVITPQEADSLRVDLINRELHLSREESKNFWPVYDAFLTKQEALVTTYSRQNNADKRNIDQLNTADLNRFINRQFEFQQQRLDLKKEYDVIFRRILPVNKLAHFYIAQEKFSSQLIRYRIAKGLTKGLPR